MSRTVRTPVHGLLLLTLVLAGGPRVRAEETGVEGAPSPQDAVAATESGAEVEFDDYVEVSDSALPESNTIATKLPTPSLLVPENVGTVTSTVLEEQNAIVLGDALRNVSSLNIQAGPSVFDFFTIRGFDSISSGLILTDGAWEPESTFLPMYNVEGVEVLKGPGGFLYGPNSLAGTVNLARKQPLPADFAVVGAQAGSFDTYQGTLDYNVANDAGDRAFRLNALWRDSDGYRDATESRFAGVNPSFNWRPSEDTSLTLNLEYLELEVAPDSGIPLANLGPGGSLALPDVPRRRSYQSPFDYSDQEVSRFQFDLEHRVNDTVRLRNKLYYRGLDWQTDGTLFNKALPPFVPGGDYTVLRTLTRLDDRQEFVGNQFEAVIEASTGSVAHEMLAGIDAGSFADEFAIDVLPPQGSNPFDPLFGMPAIGLFQPVETLTVRPTSLLPYQAGDATSLLLAPYVVDQMKFGEELHVLVGLRWDVVDFEDDLRQISRDDSELSPKVAILWAASPATSLYGNATRGWALPSARLAQNQLNTFEPEDSTQFEVGLKQPLADERVRMTLAAYEIERENLPLTLADGFTQQEADQRSWGIEAELAAELAPQLRMLFSYAFTDAELTSYARCDAQPNLDGSCPVSLTVLTSNRPAYAPEQLANLWISRSFTNGWGLAGGARYVGEQFFNEDNLFEIDDYVVLDASVSRDWEAWRARLNFQNLTDEEYETGSFSSTSIVPAHPFAVYGTVEYRF